MEERAFQIASALEQCTQDLLAKKMTIEEHARRCQELWGDARKDDALFTRVDEILQEVAMKEMNAALMKLNI